MKDFVVATPSGVVSYAGFSGELIFHEFLMTSVRTGNTEIFLMDPYTGNAVNLTRKPGSNHRYPVWSPDGARIAFTSDRDGAYNLYTMDADGENIRQLTSEKSPFGVYFPSWSGDGRRIVYGLSGDRALVCSVSPDGRLVEIIGEGRDPDISPDGMLVAFTKRLTNGYVVFIENLDGSHARQLTTHENAIGAVTPTFSPDGKRIVYSDSVGNCLELFSVDTVGGNIHQLTELGQFATSPAWSPDEQWISFRVTDEDFWNDPGRARDAYAQKKGDKRPVWVMHADGSNPHVIEALRYQCGIDGSRAVWNPSGRNR